jgi:VWFA-related protein
MVLFCLCLASHVSGQTPQNPKTPADDDVVRIQSNLVQTDVMVFDKQGRFVNGLNQADFDLRIDGKPQPLQFFERITAGSADEEAQLAAARGVSPAAKGKEPVKTVPLDRGRTVFFYVDDLHMRPADVPFTRKLLLHFIDQDMGQNDEAAITSVTGQIGFLQQISDNKTVLRAAVGRLNARPYHVTDGQRPPMTEYQALQIERYDRDLLDYFVEQIMREFPGTTRDVAEIQVHGRTHPILAQANNITTNTLAGLESLVRSSSKLSGRKLVFFISSGFFLDSQNSDATDRLRRITSAAARNGVIIYSLDARGLVASLTDASSIVAFDPSGRLERASSGELMASQDAMNALAKDTGGRMVFNTNNLDAGLAKALKETSIYYLLAWRPEHAAQANGKFRHLSVSLPSHPELTVRVRQGFFDMAAASNPPATGKEVAKPTKLPEAELREAMTASFPNADLPVAMTLNYLNTPDRGVLLTASIELSLESLVFATEAGKTQAVVDLTGAVYNDQGKAGDSFTDKVTITAGSPEQSRQAGHDFIYHYKIYVPAGLYQVRIGVRDPRSGKIGAVREWVEIPSLASHQLAMSSLIAGERKQQASGVKDAGQDANTLPPLRADRRFQRDSFLRFLVYVYNAARGPANAQPDVALQIQVLRDQQPVITTPLKKISTEGVSQLDQLPYAAEVSLAGLAAGRYELHVTTIDRISKSSASQTLRFEIE